MQECSYFREEIYKNNPKTQLEKSILILRHTKYSDHIEVDLKVRTDFGYITLKKVVVSRDFYGFMGFELNFNETITITQKLKNEIITELLKDKIIKR